MPKCLPSFYEDMAFFYAIINDTIPYPSLETALNVHQLVEKCYESYRDGKFITIEITGSSTILILAEQDQENRAKIC